MNVFNPCKELAENLADPTVPLGYANVFDEYYLIRSGGESSQLIKYCPFCGGKLPPSKRAQFFDELDQLGIQYELGDDLGQLPAAFQSDVWWRVTTTRTR